jgi:hypothetical protein
MSISTQVKANPPTSQKAFTAATGRHGKDEIAKQLTGVQSVGGGEYRSCMQPKTIWPLRELSDKEELSDLASAATKGRFVSIVAVNLLDLILGDQ